MKLNLATENKKVNDCSIIVRRII